MTVTRTNLPLGVWRGVRQSVRKKMMLLVLTTTFVALSLMGAAMMVYDLRTYRDAWIADMFAQAELVGSASAPALSFDDPKVAQENLAVLQARPNIAAAAIYSAKGALFATYVRPGLKDFKFPTLPEGESYRVEGTDFQLFKRIAVNDEILGSVYFRTSYELRQRLYSYLTILAIVMAVSLAAAILLTSMLQKSLTQPIIAMTDAARQVMERRDFAMRVGKTTDDEVGYLVEAFNAMLAEIGGRTTQLENANQSLEQEMLERRNADSALQAANRQKDQFLATLAHELRNPLAPLLNGLEVLRLSPNDPHAILATREMMERQLRQLVRLVNDLLDVSRINTGKLALKLERHEFRAIVRVAIEAAAPLMKARRHQFTVELPDRPVYLLADSSRLAQVFVNLLDNAAKFTHTGGTISLGARTDDDLLTVTVTDNGAGIAPDTLPEIGEMFVQADRSLERAQAGLGVGLSLARYLVSLHGGSVTASSEGLGRGSRFTVTLRTLDSPGEATGAGTTSLTLLPKTAAAVARGSAQVIRRVSSGQPSGSLRILLADDNMDSALSLASLLEASGHEVAVAHDGLRALQMAPVFGPDLCLLDIGMPKLHGYDLARRLRALPETRDILLVAISGWGQPEDKRRALEAGFDQHLAKPVAFVEIEALLDNFRVNRAAC